MLILTVNLKCNFEKVGDVFQCLKSWSSLEAVQTKINLNNRGIVNNEYQGTISHKST